MLQKPTECFKNYIPVIVLLFLLPIAMKLAVFDTYSTSSGSVVVVNMVDRDEDQLVINRNKPVKQNRENNPDKPAKRELGLLTKSN